MRQKQRYRELFGAGGASVLHAPCARITHRRSARARAKAAGVLPPMVRRPAPALLPHVPPPPRPCAPPRRCSVLPMTAADDCRSQSLAAESDTDILYKKANEGS